MYFCFSFHSFIYFGRLPYVVTTIFCFYYLCPSYVRLFEYLFFCFFCCEERCERTMAICWWEFAIFCSGDPNNGKTWYAMFIQPYHFHFRTELDFNLVIVSFLFFHSICCCRQSQWNRIDAYITVDCVAEPTHWWSHVIPAWNKLLHLCVRLGCSFVCLFFFRVRIESRIDKKKLKTPILDVEHDSVTEYQKLNQSVTHYMSFIQCQIYIFES